MFNQLQDNIASCIGQLTGKDPLDVKLVKNVSLLSGINNSVAHTLGRSLQGWIVVRYHGAWSDIYDLQDSNTSPNLLLTLVSSEDCTVDLLVF